MRTQIVDSHFPHQPSHTRLLPRTRIALKRVHRLYAAESGNEGAASLSEHGEFRNIAFSVDMFLFPNPITKCNIVFGLLERPKIHFTLKDIKK